MKIKGCKIPLDTQLLGHLKSHTYRCYYWTHSTVPVNTKVYLRIRAEKSTELGRSRWNYTTHFFIIQLHAFTSRKTKTKQNQWYILLKMQPILPFDKANTSALSKRSSFSASCWIPLLKISIILQSRVSNKLFWQTAVDPIQENTSTNYQSF